jgi:hypothetical protein|tara:strand:- start:5599 stop:5877 length:279 start_codon:yes stop_codon:yes gene_type:complete
MLFEIIIILTLHTDIRVNEIPVHITVDNYGYQITEADYSCTSKAIGDEVLVKLDKVCYRVKNTPNFHKVNNEWKWTGTRTYHGHGDFGEFRS